MNYTNQSKVNKVSVSVSGSPEFTSGDLGILSVRTKRIVHKYWEYFYDMKEISIRFDAVLGPSRLYPRGKNRYYGYPGTLYDELYKIFLENCFKGNSNIEMTIYPPNIRDLQATVQE
jgi:hypothetical protein